MKNRILGFILSALVAFPAFGQSIISNGSGGGGTPGGSLGNVQYNNGGAFAGMSGTSWDDTNRALTLTNGAVTQSLIATFSELKFNREGTTYVYNSNASGSIKIGVGGAADGITVSSDKTVQLSGALYTSATGNINASSDLRFRTAGAGIYLSSTSPLGWSAGSDGSAAQDTGISRLSAGSLAIGNGTAGNTSGAITALYVRTPGVTVSGLPSAATAGAGARAFVTDATACTFAATVTGGGSTACPVYSDGTNWKGG